MRIMLGFHIEIMWFCERRMYRSAAVIVSMFAMLFVSPAPAQRPVDPDEREEAVKMLPGACRAYYDLMAACVREKFPSEKAQREIDGELGALVMLAQGSNAEPGCQRQLESNRRQKVLGCEWK